MVIRIFVLSLSETERPSLLPLSSGLTCQDRNGIPPQPFRSLCFYRAAASKPNAGCVGIEPPSAISRSSAAIVASGWTPPIESTRLFQAGGSRQPNPPWLSQASEPRQPNYMLIPYAKPLAEAIIASEFVRPSKSELVSRHAPKPVCNQLKAREKLRDKR